MFPNPDIIFKYVGMIGLFLYLLFNVILISSEKSKSIFCQIKHDSSMSMNRRTSNLQVSISNQFYRFFGPTSSVLKFLYTATMLTS
jgi:hypothetical protein